jgi:hypothetical protein
MPEPVDPRPVELAPLGSALPPVLLPDACVSVAELHAAAANTTKGAITLVQS